MVCCLHPAEGNTCNAAQLTEEDLNYAFALMYQDSDKSRQDAFLTSLVKTKKARRHRPRKPEPKGWKYSAEYHVPLQVDSETVTVCAPTQSF